MSLILAGTTAASPVGEYLMTLGTNGGNLTGYATTDGSFGSLSPTSLNGQTITDIYTIGDAFLELNVIVSAEVDQDFFTSIDLTDGGIGSFNTASASYSSSGGETRWFWTSSPLASSGTIDVLIV